LFEGLNRRVGGGYHSIRSDDFHLKLNEALGERLRVKARAVDVQATRVTLASGEVLEARAVIDGRGFVEKPIGPNGFQKFVGLDVELEAPHGLEVPLLMDGRVEQHGAFRFIYLLPWDEKRLLVEDTYYADDATLDVPRIKGRIAEYLATHGFKIKGVVREELASLPIPLAGECPRFERPTSGVASGLFHATTGYSLPFAVDLADALAAREDFSAKTLTPWLQARAQRHWASQSFFRLLNRMLFRAAKPDERVRVFKSFYAHDEAVIARFYAGTSTAFDMLKVLRRGATTVPGLKAFRAAFGEETR
jgi:lycopene beta-cyclase